MEKERLEMLVVGLTLMQATAGFDWEGFFPIVYKDSEIVIGVAYADSPELYRHLEFDEEKEAYVI